MPEVDLESVVDQMTLVGLITRDQYREARADAENNSPEALIRTLLRKGWITSWQLERLKKGDLSGFFFGNYRALFHLAEGTFARVYRGAHNDNGSPVAIKVLRNRFASLPDAVTRFHKEAEAGRKLRHVNIVEVVDQGQQENQHFMIMEYVEGMNLREFLKLRVRIKDNDALPLMLGLARGLEYSHDAGVTHRDLKATNILISNTGVAKLVDFGLATIEGEEGKHGITSQRTVDYSALERTCGSPKGDPRSDVYFLGCVFYHMLTGQIPLEDSESKDPLKKMLKRSFGIIKPISEHRHAPAEPIAHIVEMMMKMDLKARYQSMHAVVSALEEYQATIDPEAAQVRELARKLQSIEDVEDMEAEDIFAALAPTAEPQPPPEVATQESSDDRAIHLPTVLCVEAQAEIQDALRKTLGRMGYRVLLVSDAERAADRYLEAPTDAVLLDTNGLGSDASIEAITQIHEKADEDGLALAVVVLLGPKQGALRDRLPPIERLRVLSKPIKMKDVQDAITELLPIS